MCCLRFAAYVSVVPVCFWCGRDFFVARGDKWFVVLLRYACRPFRLSAFSRYMMRAGRLLAENDGTVFFLANKKNGCYEA